MAARTDIVEFAAVIETIVVAAAPRAYQHALSYWLTALSTCQDIWETLFVATYECLASDLPPIRFFPGSQSFTQTVFKSFGHILQ